jgi:Leucine-rich repeat (LRR) protein
LYEQNKNEDNSGGNININNNSNSIDKLNIMRQTYFDLDGIPLTKEMMLSSFKMKSKPNNYLPVEFKQQNITSDKIYASFLQDKKISYLNNIVGFRNLKHLYLNNNKIQSLENFNFPSLNILELSDNFIRKIENLQTLPNLQNLNLEKNLICRLENISENKFLELLNLSNQYLTQFQIFEICHQTIPEDNNVSTLFLDNCNLYDPSELLIFQNIKKLKINSNKISDISLVLACVKNMKYLEVLNISNNPFIEKHKTYRNLVVIACKFLREIDDKLVTENEKLFLNSFYMRKFGHGVSGNKKIEVKENLEHGISISKMNIKQERNNFYKKSSSVSKFYYK